MVLRSSLSIKIYSPSSSASCSLWSLLQHAAKTPASSALLIKLGGGLLTAYQVLYGKAFKEQHVPTRKYAVSTLG